MTTLFESLFSLETVQSFFGFTQYDDEGYPLDDDYMNEEEELDEDLDDGYDSFEDDDMDETEWE
jgi:hypothetical protein